MAGWREFITDRKVFELFFISVLALYIELLLIRWVSSEIRIFAYFKNIVLISSFLGLGLGCAMAEKFNRRWTVSFFVVFLLTGFAGYLGLTYIIFVDPRKYYLLGSVFGDKAAPVQDISTASILFALFIIVLIFFLSVDAFFTMGLKLGELLNKFKPIVAYTINIAGSLAGVLLFALLSALWLPPYIWLFVAAAGLFYFYRRISITVAVVAVMLVVNSLLFTQYKTVWSPYYKIDLIHTKGVWPYSLLINNDIFQHGFDIENADDLAFKTSHYSFVYKLANKKPEDVLIVGAGMGNDAAAALKYNAENVDAVEIDPAILYLGEKYHPQKPYASPRVNTYVEDARAFFKKADKKYDFIIFGTLDSHVVLSAFSSIRLDNYVYTYNSIKEAQGLLKKDGIFAITFFATTDWLCERMYKALKKASGEDPIVLTSSYSGFNEYTFLVGPIDNEVLNSFDPELIKNVTDKYDSSDIALTTDNWPFLFLKKPHIPFHYILPLLILIVFSAGLISYITRKTETGFDVHMFFLGVAFMLLEVKAIAKLSLVFGSTWIVSSVVIAMILFLILLANLLIYKFPKVNFVWVYSLLLAAVLVDYFVPPNVLAESSMFVRGGVNTFIACLPVFFAAIIFANSFARVQKPNVALASNLFGVMVGGALEYISMATGIRFLAIIVILVYLVSLIVFNRPQQEITQLAD
jgi:spermidine synthase